MATLPSPFALPWDYPRCRVVRSFDELVTTAFENGVNALCWPRALPGDFGEVAARLGTGEGIVNVEEACLHDLPLGDAGRIARDYLLADQAMLRAADLLPELNCIRGSLREVDSGPVPTDVSSFHIDTATVPADTYLCTYLGATSEGLRNDEARRRVDHPATRAALLRRYGGQDDAGFRAYLGENFYDLHYKALPEARPFAFGLGNLWRIAITYPGSPVPPCIHRAPETQPGDPVRLLLIS